MTTTRNSTPTDLAVDFNFDAWEREAEVKPFVATIGGQPYQAVDPLDLDFRAFEEAGTIEMIKLLFPKDHEKILGAKVIKTGAMQAFTAKVQQHYGLGPTAD
jgi:hypothetical protein